MGTLVNGIKEIFATSQTTATHLPVCASDGTPQGRISVGDLASVLGATTIQITDCNAAPNGWSKLPAGSSGNRPSTSSTGYSFWLFTTSASNGTDGWQIGFNIVDAQMFYRTRNGDTWVAWRELSYGFPTFYKNYSSLNSLSAAIKTSAGLPNIFNFVGSNNSVHKFTIPVFGAIRFIGSDYSINGGGAIDFTVFSNTGSAGNVSCNGKTGGNSKFVHVYVDNDWDIYVRTITGMSVTFIAWGSQTMTGTTLPSTATELTVTPYP